MTTEPTDRIRSMLPFMFPGAHATEEEEVIEPPFHPELAEFSFFELYAFIFDRMRPGERVIDTMKRIDKSDEPIDEMAQWVSELFVRGEIEVIETDWVMTGIRAAKIGYLEEIKWDLEENGVVSGGHSGEELAPRARVLAAEDARVKIEGTEEWVPVEKINFKVLVL
jgi:hypothetical protein